MRRNFHDLSHEHKTSTNMGYLVPINTMEVLPGDTFVGSTSMLARVAPLANPVMHNVQLRVHHFFVPNRIIWDKWQDWITGEDAASEMPVVAATDDTETPLLDYMGVPPVIGTEVSALPVRAYNLIYNEFYRDQDLAAKRDLDNLTVAQIAWEKDYFTTCRPQPQQGEPIDIEFTAGEVPIKGIGWSAGGQVLDPTYTLNETGQVQRTTIGQHVSSGSNATAQIFLEADVQNGEYPNVRADMSQATGGISVDSLRRSIGLQRLAEARMRYGSRYVDYLRFLGINPSDGRLDRPEFLGGGVQTINFSEVLATAEGNNSNVGDMYGHGIAAVRSKRYRKMFEEHGWVITLLSARPKTVYMNNVPRQYLRRDHVEYWQKELEIMPWQEVKQNEVFANGDPNTTFGYAPRYNEYRHHMSYVSGSFRTTEKDWHMAREFATPPTLNESFIRCTPTDRIYQDTSMPELLINARNDIRAMRLVRKEAQL